MAKTVKMCDMSGEVAAKVFQMLNYEEVKLVEDDCSDCGVTIITDVQPRDLVYPEGWYYAKGRFSNKHNSTTGMYWEVPMNKSERKSCKGDATYCTRD